MSWPGLPGPRVWLIMGGGRLEESCRRVCGMARGESGPSRAGGLAFDLVASKLHLPAVRPGTVDRSPLVERLARGDPRPVVSVAAPAGYGKTTLLAQWAERDGRAFAWVSVGE